MKRLTSSEDRDHKTLRLVPDKYREHHANGWGLARQRGIRDPAGMVFWFAEGAGGAMKFSENAFPDRGTSGNDDCGSAANALHIRGQFWATTLDFFHIMKNVRTKLSACTQLGGPPLKGQFAAIYSHITIPQPHRPHTNLQNVGTSSFSKSPPTETTHLKP